MTNNKQQTSIDWFFDQLVLNRIIIINGSTYWDKVKTKYELLLDQAREMYQDEIEAAAIISSAEQSTKAANQKTEAFAIGYDQGYNRALDLVQWKINNELKNTK
jgi:hypothetical protein